jgi:hypothetical protein
MTTQVQRRQNLNHLVDEAIRTRVEVRELRIDLSSLLLEETRKTELESALKAADLKSEQMLLMLREHLLHGELCASEENA